MATSNIVERHITQLLPSFRQILEFFRNKLFLLTCYIGIFPPSLCDYVLRQPRSLNPPVVLLLNVPMSLFKETFLLQQKNPRRRYRLKISGTLLFLCHDPGSSIPYCPPPRAFRRTPSNLSTDSFGSTPMPMVAAAVAENSSEGSSTDSESELKVSTLLPHISTTSVALRSAG